MKNFITPPFFYLYCQLSWGAHDTYPYNTVERAANIEKCYQGTCEGIFPLKLQVGIDYGFSSQQKSILDTALSLFMERALKPHVIDCAYRRSHKDFPVSREKFVAQLLESLRPLPINSLTTIPSFAFIAMYNNDYRSVGVGYVNLFYDTDKPLHPFSHRHYLHIALNSDYLGPGANYFYKNNAEYWAGVIAHEFLHNLGYRHPTGYPGSFIKEYGNCVHTNGIESELVEGLEDLEVYRKLDECG